MDGDLNESKENLKKVKRGTQSSNNEKAQIIYEYDVLEAFLIDNVGNLQNQHIKKQ